MPCHGARTKPSSPCDSQCRLPLFGGVPWLPDSPETSMAQTNNRFFDEAARLMNDAAGVAQGVRREFDTMLRHQAERILGDLDVVRREEFEAVKEMARLAREENEALKARIAMLEAKVEAKPAETKFAAGSGAGASGQA